MAVTQLPAAAAADPAELAAKAALVVPPAATLAAGHSLCTHGMQASLPIAQLSLRTQAAQDPRAPTLALLEAVATALAAAAVTAAQLATAVLAAAVLAAAAAALLAAVQAAHRWRPTTLEREASPFLAEPCLRQAQPQPAVLAATRAQLAVLATTAQALALRVLLATLVRQVSGFEFGTTALPPRSAHT